MKTVEKTSTHTTKRNADGVAQTKVPVNTAPRRTGPGGNEGGTSTLFPRMTRFDMIADSDAAFRDRQAGSDRNRGKPTDEAPRGGARGGFGARGRGGT